MGSTKLTLTRKNPEDFNGDLLIYCLGLSNKDKVNIVPTPVDKELKKAIRLGDFKGNCCDTLLIYPQTPVGKKVSTERVLFLGLGQPYDKSTIELRELCRKVGGTIAAKAKELQSARVGLSLPEIHGLTGEVVVECLVEGILLGDYQFVKYKNLDKDKKKPLFNGIQEISIYSAAGTKGLRRGMDKAQHASVAACTARDMANEPGNGWIPASFAAYGRALAKKNKMNCTVLGKSDMKRLKMGGLLAVNQGSAEPPKLVILEYKTLKKRAQTILIVGKGLTFDSGGVSLKPAAGMEDMKYDMCGGAAVLSAMGVVGEEKPDVNVVAIIPATDNMGGSSALKPGDIIRHYGGITSEIVNTDAEGRLILADALAYGIKKFSPSCVVDIATLTGAVIMGLGHHRTGLLGNNQTLVDRVLAAGEKCGEPLWQLPLDKEYSKQIDSDVADIRNIGGRPAGTITAAAYLQKFVGDTPWTHLDIAGTAWDFTKKSYIPKGPSGTGVRTLVELIRSWKKLS
jgi:leucyl aminopeptidase